MALGNASHSMCICMKFACAQHLQLPHLHVARYISGTHYANVCGTAKHRLELRCHVHLYKINVLMAAQDLKIDTVTKQDQGLAKALNTTAIHPWMFSLIFKNI